MRLVGTLLLLFLAALVAERQASDDPLSASEVPRVLGPDPVAVLEGATLPLVLVTAISSGTSRSGDLVVARLAADIRVGEAVIVPAGIEVRGRVTGVVASGGARGLARLGFEFDKLVLKGREHSIGTKPVEINGAEFVRNGLGTGFVLSSKDHEVELSTGTLVIIRLTRETRP